MRKYKCQDLRKLWRPISFGEVPHTQQLAGVYDVKVPQNTAYKMATVTSVSPHVYLRMFVTCYS